MTIYAVEFIEKRKVLVEVEANSPGEAEMKAQDLWAVDEGIEVDAWLYDTEVRETNHERL